MDPKLTLESQTVQTISESYFNSLNDPTNTKLHLVSDKHASIDEIRTDVKGWYGGFMACAKLFGANPSNLPPLDSLAGVIQKSFPDRARIGAAA